MKCIFCEKDFVIKPTGKSGGWNRQLCYDCLPEGCNSKEKHNISKYYLRKRAGIEKIKRGCDICGYNKSSWALEWHHPEDNKDYNPSFLLSKGNREGWELYQQEIKKCQLLCSNCHREIHEQIYCQTQKYNDDYIQSFKTDEYEKLREDIKIFYLKNKNLSKTAKHFHKDVETIKTILKYYNIEIKNINNGIKVAQLDKVTEEVIQTYNSIADASRALGVDPRGSHIGEVCRGKRKTAQGYKWKYIGD